MRIFRSSLLGIALVAMAVLAFGVGQTSASLLVTGMNEDFETPPDYPDITLGDGTPAGEPWGYGNKTSMTYHAAGYTTNTTSVLKVDQTVKGGSNYGPYWTGDGPAGPTSGTWIMDLDVALDQGVHNNKLYYRQAGGATLFELYFVGSSVNINYAGPSVIAAANPGQWYHITLTIDLDNDNVDAAVDGSPVLTDVPINDGQWDNVGVQTYVADPAVTYLDNLVITPEPVSLVLLLLGLPSLRRRR